MKFWKSYYCRWNPRMSPLVVIIMATVHSGSNPPLVLEIVSGGSNVVLSVLIADQFLNKIILATTMALVHIDQPAFVPSTDDLGISLRNCLPQAPEKNALDLVPPLADVPAVRAVLGVLSSCKCHAGHEQKFPQHSEKE